jgi:hypothetical protein
MTASTEQPPRWAERLLRLFLHPRDRDTIAGDLLEEYRDTVLPARGRLRARLWYVRQVLSLIDGVTLGLIVGGLFGAANLAFTWLIPLLEDSPRGLLSFYGPMFLIWTGVAFLTARRSGSLTQAIKAGLVIGLVAFATFLITNLLRINLFLDQISHRDDWRNLVTNYQQSGFGSLRAYANYVYALTSPLLVIVGAGLGAATGLLGGLAGLAVGAKRRIST